MDPYAVLELPQTLDLDPEDLESRWLARSRDCHPDFHQGLDEAEQIAMLNRAAELNDAYQLLRNPWRRAEALIELRSPGAMDATKSLCPMFLMEAMEAREEAENATGDAAETLYESLRKRVDQYFRDVGEQLEAGHPKEAATLLHQSNYYRKALRDLRDRLDSEL